MILFYDAEGKIISTSTWTLANPATYLGDGYLMIANVGQRPLPVDAFCFDFQPDASAKMAALMPEIEAEKERFTIRDGALCKDGDPLALDFAPGSASAARNEMENDPQVVALFGMTNEQMAGYMVANFGFTPQQVGAFVIIRNVLRDLARAAGVAKR